MGRPAKIPKGITLAKFERWDPVLKTIVKDRDAEKIAMEAEPGRATPERAAKAVSIEVGADRVQRVTDAPLEVMRARGMLAPKDPDRNRLLYEAGCEFRQRWHDAGLNGLGAMDLGRVGSGDGHPAWAIPSTEFAMFNRQKVRDALLHIGAYLGQYLVAVVIDERPLEEAGRMFTGRLHRTTAIAIAGEIIIASLTSLAIHWGTIGRGSDINRAA